MEDHQPNCSWVGTSAQLYQSPNSALVPKWPYIKEFQQANKKLKQQQKTDYNCRHRVRDLPEILDNTDVWITTGERPIVGRIITSSDTPRSYVVGMPTGKVRRNRSQLNIALSTMTDPQAADNHQIRADTNGEQLRSPIMTRSSTGVISQ